MCSIMGYLGKGLSKEAFTEALLRTQSRGPDGWRVCETPFGLLGFARLAIMGLTDEGMQPFHREGCQVVCNGELYGFRTLRAELEGRGYRFAGGSDCELLPPLYREYGLEMFRHLDAEFACLLWDETEERLIAARDPIGIRPLFYGVCENGGMAFASEAKSLAGWVREIKPFPPGHYWCDGHFVRYADPGEVRLYRHTGLDEACEGIRRRLTAAVEKRLDADAPLGFLLSGGLDSSLVCAIAARRLQAPLRTFAIGMETDPIDLKYARQAAVYLGARHTEVTMSRKDVLEAVRPVIAALASWDVTTVRASIGMYLLCKAIRERTDIKVLLTGEVSDELFGYKYTDFAPSAAAFQAEAQKRVRELYCYDVLRADRCLAAHGLEARVPFGDLAFVEYVMSLDPALKRNTYGKGKYLLRRAFSEGGWLPEALLWREKAAFSDAVGHSMVDELKAFADGLYTDAAFEQKRAAYPYCPPFSKESLWYREIFEECYPGQAAMLPAFWMPNRAWPGCDVADPSARVLTNYGDSGK